MKERPILMSAPMVRAILAGTKTQTRRVVKPQPPAGWDRNCWFSAPVWGWTAQAEPAQTWHKVRCPYGQPGDRLWVRETWNRFEAWQGYFYAADDHSFGIGADDDPDHIPEHAIRWKPSIHMPRAASRITLEVTGVRVERLQDISAADAIAEGIEAEGDEWRDYLMPHTQCCLTPRSSYRTLWESIHGPGSWDANPWVWVIEFRRIEA